MRRRWVILALGLPVYAFLLMLAGTAAVGLIITEHRATFGRRGLPHLIEDSVTDSEWWFYLGTSALVIVALQAVFLLPMFHRRPPRDRRGHSLTVSLLIGGLVAAALTAGLGLGAMDLVSLIVDPQLPFDEQQRMWWMPLTMLVAGWVLWTSLLLVRATGIWADRTLGRLVGLLFAGTVVELLLVLPLDVMVRRRTDCYCATGTFFSLVIAAVATLWLTGPGVVIALTARRHRLWRERHCERCGYERGPSPGPRCPECGHAWSRRRSRFVDRIRGRRYADGGDCSSVG